MAGPGGKWQITRHEQAPHIVARTNDHHMAVLSFVFCKVIETADSTRSQRFYLSARRTLRPERVERLPFCHRFLRVDLRYVLELLFERASPLLFVPNRLC